MKKDSKQEPKTGSWVRGRYRAMPGEFESRAIAREAESYMSTQKRIRFLTGRKY